MLVPFFVELGTRAMSSLVVGIMTAAKPAISQLFTAQWLKSNENILGAVFEPIEGVFEVLHHEIRKPAFFGQLVKRVLTSISTAYTLAFVEAPITVINTKLTPNFTKLIESDIKQLKNFFDVEWVNQKTKTQTLGRIELILTLLKSDDGFFSAHYLALIENYTTTDCPAENVLLAILEKRPELTPIRKKEIIEEFAKVHDSSKKPTKKKDKKRGRDDNGLGEKNFDDYVLVDDMEMF